MMGTIPMTMMKLLGALVLCGAAAPAFAASGTPTPPQTQAGQPDPLCASYGKDFVRVAGSSTCVRVSGQVQADTYVGSFQGSDALSPALKSK